MRTILADKTRGRSSGGASLKTFLHLMKEREGECCRCSYFAALRESADT